MKVSSISVAWTVTLMGLEVGSFMILASVFVYVVRVYDFGLYVFQDRRLLQGKTNKSALRGNTFQLCHY